MSLAIGIVGLPNVGKSTLFQVLTKKPVDISNYPFCTIEPNVGVVEVSDARLAQLAEISKPEKIVPSIVKFVDVAGLVKGASHGEGLGNQFLAHLRDADALLEVVRCFQNEDIVHIEGRVDPKRDIQTIESELILKDLETVEKRLEKIEGDVKQGKKEAKTEFEILNSLKFHFQKGKNGRVFFKTLEESGKKILKDLCLLTIKPQTYLLNCFQKEAPDDLKKWLESEGYKWLCLDLREEIDKSGLTEQERQELGLKDDTVDALVRECYNMLELITFFTIVGNKEARAWSIKKGSTVLEGAEKVHSDFREKFIRAEVINCQQLLPLATWKRAGELGLLKTVGRDYILQDGDVVEIKLSP